MIRFASFGTNQLTQAHMLATQTRMFETQMQIVSGKVSRSYAGVAIDSRRLVNLENSVSEVSGFIKNIDVIESRLQMMENTVAGAFDVATRIRDLLVNALNADNAASLSLNQRAEDFLHELTGAINVKQDNRFLFSGSRIDVPPVPMADAAAVCSVCVMLRSTRRMPLPLAIRAVSPLSVAMGWPRSSGRISMSVQEIFPRQPVPIILRIASLAAHRPAMKGMGSL